jgi:hypothetical protein
MSDVMLRRPLVGLIVSFSLLSIGACAPRYTVSEARSHIKTCSTKHTAVLKHFGRPDEVGELSGLVTYTYASDPGVVGSKSSRMIVAFDASDTVVDLVVNPAGIVELKNRCLDEKVEPKKPEPNAPGTALLACHGIVTATERSS